MFLGLFRKLPPATALPDRVEQAVHERDGFNFGRTTERGFRATPENQVEYLYRRMWVDTRLRAKILDIRDMDEKDPRVKKIHRRMANTAIKGGLMLRKTTNRRLRRAWENYSRRCRLLNPQKLYSDARGLAMEGNLPMQWILDGNNRVVSGIRMPSETIVPIVEENGQFHDPRMAYQQWDVATAAPVASFALWQLDLVRLDPPNFDDRGSMGRPYLDAARKAWRQLNMTEEDLVVRRRVRAPLRLAHSLENATEAEVQAYRKEVEDDQNSITTDFYSNKKLTVQAVQGDSNLDQIADVVHLLDTFFAGAPAPKGLFGYTEGLARDILEDMKRDYFEEIDAVQEVLAGVYQSGFELDLLLQGINPDLDDIMVTFAERNTETKNQAADRALKYKSIGASNQTTWETAGLDPNEELERREEEAESTDPYPETGAGGSDVSITPGNAPKGESATDVTND